MVLTRSQAKGAAPEDAALNNHPTSAVVESSSVGKSNNAPTTTKKVATKKSATKKAGKANTTRTSNRGGKDPPAVDSSLVVTPSATGKAKATTIAKTTKSAPQASETGKPTPWELLSDEALKNGLKTQGDKFLDLYENDSLNEQIKKRIVSISGREVTGTLRKGLVSKLRVALRLEGLGVDENGEEIGLSDISRQDIKKAKSLEKCVFYKFRLGFAPTSQPMEYVTNEIIEYVESNGERFFADKTDAWLKEQLGITYSYKQSRRHLVNRLRKEKGYSLSNFQPESAGDLQPQDDAPAQSANNRPAAGGATSHAAVVPPPICTGVAEIGGANFNDDNNGLVPQPAAAVVAPTPNRHAVEDQAVSQRDFTTYIGMQSAATQALVQRLESGTAWYKKETKLTETKLQVTETKLQVMQGQMNKLGGQVDGLGQRVYGLETTVDNMGGKLDDFEAEQIKRDAEQKKTAKELKTIKKSLRNLPWCELPPSSCSTTNSDESGNFSPGNYEPRNLGDEFDGKEEEEEEEDSKQQAKNENQNIATPAVKPRRVAGNDAITVEPLLKHNNGPSLKTPAVVGSIVRNDDGDDDGNRGDDNHGVEAEAQIILPNIDNGGLKVENVAALNEDFDGEEEEEEEEEDSKQQAKNENQNIATPAVKPRRVAGNDAITVEPLLKHNNGPSLKTPAVVGSIVRNDDGDDDGNRGDDNHGVEAEAQIILPNIDNGGLKVENVAALNEDFDGEEEEEEEEEDSKQQAKNENQNIATPAVKPRRVAGNDAITVEPLLKHNNGPSLKTPAVVGSIVRNDDGNDDNRGRGDDNRAVEAQTIVPNIDNGGLRVENVAALNEGGKEEEDSNSEQQAKNENQNIATPNGVEVSFHRNAYRNINDGLDSSPEAGSPMSEDSVNEDEDADAGGNDQGGGILSPTIIQSFGKLSLFSPPSNTNK